MSELTLALIKLGFLALLWVFAFSIASTIRADLFGARPKAPKAARTADAAPGASRPPKQPKPAKPAKGSPRSIVVTEGADAGTSATLADQLTIGRGPGNTIPLVDEYVSTQHARLVLHEGRWFVEDLGSTNGTYVSGARITGPTPIGDRSMLRVGRTVLELRK
jgi:pSer/pThr/pTyr-binding forkhead associated (FHA) protein